MWYQIHHATCYEYGEPVSVCHSEAYLSPRTLPYQKCHAHELTVLPQPAEIRTRHDLYGNRLHFFSIEEPHRSLEIRAKCLVELTAREAPPWDSCPAWDTLPGMVRQDRSAAGLATYWFAFDSCCVQRSADLLTYAAESFPAGRPILLAVQDLTARVHRDFRYLPGATDVRTPVEEVLRRREGVCQDFAHLQIGCLRSLGLPARYVSGYLQTEPPPGQPRLVGADASHAWLSVYCGSLGWVDFDPTNNTWVGANHVTLAWGRDYEDVCPVRGVYVGGGRQTLEISVDVEPVTPTSSATSAAQHIE